MNILLAIEEAKLRLAIELLLTEEPGVKVVGEASESEGLLALINTTRPELVVLDSDLPGQSFTELLAEIRSRHIVPRLIVLDKDPANRQQVLEAGASAFVVKGDPPEMLIAAFRESSSRGAPSNQGTEVE